MSAQGDEGMVAARRKTWLCALLCVFACAVSASMGVWLQGRYCISEALPLRLRLKFRPPPRAALALTPHQKERMWIFALLGQSNMSGTGRAPFPDLSDRRIFVFGNDYRWKRARTPLDDSRDQVDLVSADHNAGFGPGLAFARTLLQRYPGRPIGLVPCALWGSRISQWLPSWGDHTLYGACLKRLRSISGIGRLKGILFFQGEADAMKKTSPQLSHREPRWGRSFQKIVIGLRRDLRSPQLPVVFAQLGPTPRSSVFRWWGAIQGQQAAISMPGVVMIKTNDLPMRDRVHFSNQGYIVIGQRFAKAYLSLR